MIKILDTEGKIGFRAMTASEYSKLKIELKKQYMEQGRKWVAASKKAESEGAECTVDKPVKPRYKSLDKLSSRANAQKLAAKYKQRYEAEKRAKEQTAPL